MSLNFIFGVLLICVGFVCSRVILNFLRMDGGEIREYTFLKDPWLYIFFLTGVGLLAIFFLMPNFNDVVVPLTITPLGVLLGLSLLIYVVFLLEEDWLFYLVLAGASLVLAFMIPDEVLLFEGLVPLRVDRLIVAAAVFIFTSLAQWLNGLPNIFTIQCLTITIGLFVMALVGGVSQILGFAGACLAGVWLGLFNLNQISGTGILNNGACAAAAFVFSGLLIDGALEMAGPSMVILIMYALSEGMWSIVCRYILGIKRLDWSDNTTYMSVADKGASIDAINTAVIKIGLVNVMLAGFQLFAVNAFSIPLFALAVNLWLLSMLYNADNKKQSLREVNRDFVSNIKEELKEIQQSFRKGKGR